jgi:phage tail-like protein
MALPDLDTSVGHSFGLEFDGIVITAIQEVSGLKLEQDVIELKQNTPDGKFMIKKLPGRPKAGEVTLTRGLTSDTSFEDWVNSSQFGQMTNARKGGAIIVFDYEGNPIKRYNLTNAWPKSLEIGSLKAGDTNVLTEKLTITYEVMEAGAG